MRVGISGSYGGMNLGDEAILQVMLAELRRSLPTDGLEITVFSRRPEDTERRHRVDHVERLGGLPRQGAMALLRELDLLVVGGGGILFDGDAELYLREAALAQEVGTPVMVYAVGAGPLTRAVVREQVRRVLEGAALVTVRDQQSRYVLEGLGVSREIEVTADPALLLGPEPMTLEEILRAEAIDPEVRLIGFSVREPGPAAPGLAASQYHELVANAADFAADRFDAEVVFFPLERETFDARYSHAVVGSMRHAHRATVLKRAYSPGQILALLCHFEFAVGMRLHFLIFSALAGLPFVALPYASKVSGLLEELGVETPALGEVSGGQVIAQLDRAWDTREALCAGVAQRLGGLQSRARHTNELLVRLLSGRRAGAA